MQPRRYTIPAQITVFMVQMAKIMELAEEQGDTVAVSISDSGGDALDIWLLDQASLDETSHRSVVIDSNGEVLGDTTLPDS